MSSPIMGGKALRRAEGFAIPAIILAALFVRDRPIYEAIRGFRPPTLNSLMDLVGSLRGPMFPILVALALIVGGMVFRRPKIWRGGVAVLLAVTLCGLTASALKLVFARPGPKVGQALPSGPWFAARYGRFPSTHAAALFGSAGALAEIVPAAAPVGFAVAALVGYERIYSGVHWPSDVFAGAWLGLVLSRLLVRRLARHSHHGDPSRSLKSPAQQELRSPGSGEEDFRAGTGCTRASTAFD
jgi:undecaprenyl-diphosphatase